MDNYEPLRVKIVVRLPKEHSFRDDIYHIIIDRNFITFLVPHWDSIILSKCILKVYSRIEELYKIPAKWQPVIFTVSAIFTIVDLNNNVTRFGEMFYPINIKKVGSQARIAEAEDLASLYMNKLKKAQFPIN